MTHVSVIIVNFNSGRLLKRVLDSLTQQTRLADRVIVVDNDSQDNSLDNLPELAGLEIIRAGSNLGFAKANNMAVSKIHDSKYIVLLNPDTFADTNFLENLLTAAEQNPEYHFFASKMIDDQSRDYYDGAGDVYHMSGLTKRRYHGLLLNDEDDQVCEVFTPCAGAAMYYRSVFNELQGFDESFFCYMEDVDLGFRMQLKGYRGLYINNAIVYHVGSAITGRHSDFSIYYGHRNLVWTYVKNMPLLLLVVTLPYHLVVNLMTIVFFIYRGMGGTILKAKKDAIKGIPDILKKRHQVQKERISSNMAIWSQLDKSLFSFLFCHAGLKKHFFCSGKKAMYLKTIIKNSFK